MNSKPKAQLKTYPDITNKCHHATEVESKTVPIQNLAHEQLHADKNYKLIIWSYNPDTLCNETGCCLIDFSGIYYVGVSLDITNSVSQSLGTSLTQLGSTVVTRLLKSLF